MVIKQAINELINLSLKERNESKRIDEKCGIDSDFGISILDPRSIEAAFSVNIYSDKIKDLLNNYSIVELLVLETLMYYGRQLCSEENPDINLMYDFFEKRNDSKEELVRTISEKSGALSRYFNLALVEFSKKNIDVENYFAKDLKTT